MLLLFLFLKGADLPTDKIRHFTSREDAIDAVNTGMVGDITIEKCITPLYTAHPQQWPSHDLFQWGRGTRTLTSS